MAIRQDQLDTETTSAAPSAAPAPAPALPERPVGPVPKEAKGQVRSAILAWQQAAGNRAVTAMLGEDDGGGAGDARRERTAEEPDLTPAGRALDDAAVRAPPPRRVAAAELAPEAEIARSGPKLVSPTGAPAADATAARPLVLPAGGAAAPATHPATVAAADNATATTNNGVATATATATAAARDNAAATIDDVAAMTNDGGATAAAANIAAATHGGVAAATTATRDATTDGAAARKAATDTAAATAHDGRATATDNATAAATAHDGRATATDNPVAVTDNAAPGNTATAITTRDTPGDDASASALTSFGSRLLGMMGLGPNASATGDGAGPVAAVPGSTPTMRPAPEGSGAGGARGDRSTSRLRQPADGADERNVDATTEADAPPGARAATTATSTSPQSAEKAGVRPVDATTGAEAGATPPLAGTPTPGFAEKKPPAPPAKPRPKHPGAQGGQAGPKKGGGAAAAKPARPPLNDPTLERWRTAAAGAIDATKAGEMTEAKEGPEKVAAKGKEIDATRKEAQPDFEADAKAKQPPMPEEPKKEDTLDTRDAEAAVEAVQKAGDKKLSTQTFSAVGTPPPYPTLNPRDFVPKTMLTAITDLEAKLADKSLPKSEREKLTKQLEAAKKKVAAVEQRAKEGTPAEAPPSVVDEGPARLTPPDPAMADVLGDAIARCMGKVEPGAKGIVKRALTSMHGDKVPRAMAMAETEEGTVRSELERELEGIAAAAGLTDKQLTAKVEEQKELVKKEKAAIDEGLAASSVAATKQVEERAKQEGKKIGGAKDAVDAEVKAKQEAVAGPPDTEAIEKKKLEYEAKVTEAGAQTLAGLKASFTKREAEIDSAAGQHRSTIRGAADNQANAIRRHWSEDPDPNKGMVEARPTADWGKTRAGQVDGEVKAFKAASQAEYDGFVAGVTTQLTTSKEQVRDWAARQEGRERSWWDRLIDMIRDWSTQANANSDAWEKQRNAESRDAMAADFSTLTDLRTAQVTGNHEAFTKEMAGLDGERQKLAQTYLSGGISSIEFVAESTMARISGRRAPELAKAFEERAIAEWDWEDLGQLARATNPGFQPKVLAAKVRGGVAGWGTTESKVYEGLGGARSAVERASLEKCYQTTYGVSMAEDIRDDMEDHELERAEALMAGKGSEASAAAIKEALDGGLTGIGTDEEEVRQALRGKSPEELAQIKADYLRMYGVELKTDLADEMEDAELDNALALSEGDLDKADAAELEDAMDGPGTDEDKLKKVYERIREEEAAKARAEGLTPAELDARIKARNARVKAQYGAKYGNLDVNMTAELADVDEGAVAGLEARGSKLVDNADIKLMAALQEGDPAKIDAAKALKEHEGVYASDDAIEGIARNQHAKADLEVNLDLGAEKAKLRALVEAGDISMDEYKERMKAWGEKDKAKDAAIKDKAMENMADLKGAYAAATGGTQSFDQLVAQETSGYSQLEIQDLVAAGGKLSPEDEMFYATAGAGTDEKMITDTLKGKTPAEIDKIRKAYEAKHGEGSFDSDILGDLSGREDLDVGHTLTYGDPSTFAKQLEEEKDPAKRKALLAGMKKMLDERAAFEESGVIGSIFAGGADPMNSAAQLADAVDRAEKYDAALTAWHADPANEGKSPDDDPLLLAAKTNFDMNYAGAVEAQEQVRAQIDAYADILAQVGAAVVGIAVTAVTFGTAGLVMAAVYGAMAAAASTMYLKATLRGNAYSWEEAGVDLATGAIDVAATAATAGLGNKVMAAMKAAVGRQALKAAAKEGVEEATESAVKAWMREAVEEVIENSVQAIPSAAAGALLDDQPGDPFDKVVKASATAAGMGAGMGVGAKGAIDAGGAAVKGLRGPAPGAPGAGHAGTPHGPTAPDVDAPAKGVDLPETTPGAAAAAKAATEGELPAGPKGVDTGDGGAVADLPRAPGTGSPEGPRPRKGGGDEAGPGATKAGGGADGTPGPVPPDVPGDAVITDFPEGSVGQLPPGQAADATANKEFFRSWMESDPRRETALLRNSETGEFVVVQGTAKRIDVEADNPNWAQELLPPELHGTGAWVYVAHSHPVDASGVTPEWARWPSGSGGDLQGAADLAIATKTKVSEELHYTTKDGTEVIRYGYDPDAPEPYFVERVGPDGSLETRRYKSMEEYHEEYFEIFGGQPGNKLPGIEDAPAPPKAGGDPDTSSTGTGTGSCATPDAPPRGTDAAGGATAKGAGVDGGGPPHPATAATSAGSVDVDHLRSLSPAAATDLHGGGRGVRPSGPPNSVVDIGGDMKLVFDGEGKLLYKVTPATMEHVQVGKLIETEGGVTMPSGVTTNTPHEVADALGIRRRQEGVLTRELGPNQTGDGSFVVEGTVGDLIARPEAPNYQNKFAKGADVEVGGVKLSDYERAHMFGPGFGAESINGIMLAPSEVNQAIQNSQIEKIVRELHRSGAAVTVEIKATPHPGKITAYDEDRLLKSVRYEVRVVHPDGRTFEMEVSFTVGPPPKGAVSSSFLELRPGRGYPIDGEAKIGDEIADMLDNAADARAARLEAGIDVKPRKLSPQEKADARATKALEKAAQAKGDTASAATQARAREQHMAAAKAAADADAASKAAAAQAAPKGHKRAAGVEATQARNNADKATREWKKAAGKADAADEAAHEADRAHRAAAARKARTEAALAAAAAAKTAKTAAPPAPAGPTARRSPDAPGPTLDRELDDAFAALEAGQGPGGDTLHQIDSKALRDTAFEDGVATTTLADVARVDIDEGGVTTTAQPVPPTLLADVTPRSSGDQPTFRPQQTDDGRFAAQNVIVRADATGSSVATPTSGAVGAAPVVGGVRGAELVDDGTWEADGGLKRRTPQQLGQEGDFAARDPAQWFDWEQGLAPMSDAERYALWYYTDDASSLLNPALRDQGVNRRFEDSRLLAQVVSDVDASMQPLPFDATVHRRASVQDFADLGVTDPAQLVALKGQTYTHQGYTSTSVTVGDHWEGDIHLEIEAPTGTRGRYVGGADEAATSVAPVGGAPPGSPIASMPAEMELVLERGTTYRILDATYDPDADAWKVKVRVEAQGMAPDPLRPAAPSPGSASGGSVAPATPPGGPGPGARSAGPSPHVTVHGHAAPVPGPTTLTAPQLAELQAIADRFQTTLHVVGDRGAGTGSDTGLIQVVVDGIVDIATRGQVTAMVHEACQGRASVASTSGSASGPHITISPRA